MTTAAGAKTSSAARKSDFPRKRRRHLTSLRDGDRFGRRSLAEAVDDLWITVCLFSTSDVGFNCSTRALTGSSEVIPEVQ